MFWKKILELCSEKNTTPSQLCRDIGLATASASGWKRGAVPRDSTLKKIATYFGVPLESLTADDPPELPTEPPPTLIDMEQTGNYMIPLYENVSAGFGTLAVDSVVDHIPLYFKTKSEAERTICIRVRGDSMSPKIEDGDIVQVRKQDTVDSGSLAVVIVDGDEGYIKYVIYDGSDVRLRSVNSSYKPLIFKGEEALRVRVVGLVKTIIRSVSGREEIPAALTESPARSDLINMLQSLTDDQLKELESYANYLASRSDRS